MGESRGRKTQMKKLITESDIEAAQQLIQLSEEDNNSHNNNNKKLIMGKRNRRRFEDEEVDQSVYGDIELEKKIQEVFGENQIFQPKKKKRYRSLKNVYKETKPVKGTKKVSASENEERKP
ncbi:hypothetical protein TanjilG_24361 [Lupinus angustifolius]|uniref:Uncharacterized protein n=1 Tax=Lupinus angustifolius TaxID=3871 RepID=A0A1J7G4I4_LUPAN|nr:PREDICTED: uncharacterized protein LOC109341520 [Lupinus angustifolius]OIV89241.1 hypothetical protein TanjilG_24361 [Lupinus angustifolius]